VPDPKIVDAIQKHFTAKGLGKCPLCGHGNFLVGDLVMLPIQTDPGVYQIGGPSIPMVPVICENCYSAIWIAAVPLGVVPGDPKG